MLNIEGYEVKEKIHFNSEIEIYRALDATDNKPVIIKSISITNEFHPSVLNLKNEYETLKYLSSNQMLQVYKFQKHSRGYYLTYEDNQGVSLKEFAHGEKISLDEFYKIAIKMSEILSEVHRKKVIHKDIKPENIIIRENPFDLKIIDFGISTRLSKEETKWFPAHVLEGSLHYISPEQTGRMNRSVDYRSDFYSLGITFYELVTGSLPFVTNDLLELIHCHLAKTPPMAHEVNPGIPVSLSQIIDKLTSKTAENRYQTALGLKLDLEKSRNLYEQGKLQESFPLGSTDISNEFKIPQKLYGRELDIITLIENFVEVHETGKSKIALISGYSGVGKSSLVKEINKPITASRGYFLNGKYDQYNRNLPFSAIIQVFTNLIRIILTETPENIDRWKIQILNALGPNGRVITDVIPELEFIIGEQPPAPELGSQENSNRFYLVFQNFIKVFCSFEHPLAIFLDDLQWADSASLNLIKNLMQDSSMNYLFLILAYRNNEIDDTHPFNLTINSLKKEGVTPFHIELQPLLVENVNFLLSESLFCSKEECMPLAELVFQKTGGNPFFITELLKQLTKEDSIAFNYEIGKWEWFLDKIKTTKISDNVVELLIQRIQKLSDKTQNILRLASCIGNIFDLGTLSLINKIWPQETAKDLQETIKEELIYPIGDSYRLVDSMGEELKDRRKNFETSKKIFYRFQHDRVQQASYELLNTQEKKELRLKIGRILLANTDKEENLFDIVTHLNIGSELITEREEKIKLAELNLEAGIKAKLSTAYKPSLEYLTQAQKLLSETGSEWESHYELSLNIYKTLAEVNSLNGQTEESEKLLNLLIDKVRTDSQKADIYSRLILEYLKTFRYVESLETGIKALSLLNINISEENIENTLNEETRHLDQYQTEADTEKIYNNPDLQNPELIIALRILGNLGVAAYLTGKVQLYVLIAIKRIDICLVHGNHPFFAVALVEYSLTLSAGGNYKRGYLFGSLGYKLCQKWGKDSLYQTCTTFHVFSNFLNSWIKHVKNTHSITEIGFQAGLDSGNLLYAGYLLLNQPLNLFYQGEKLSEIQRTIQNNLKFSRKTQDQLSYNSLLASYFNIVNLEGLNISEEDTDNLVTMDEKEYLQKCKDSKDLFSLSIYLTLKAYALYLSENYTGALETIEESRDALISVPSLTSIISSNNFFHSLILCALYKGANKTDRVTYFTTIKENQKQMKTWAENCPENFLHKYLLIEAEIAKIEYKNWKAAKLYDEAISEARKNDFRQNEALANELAAKFWFKKKNLRFAQEYMLEAYKGYEFWGAFTKAQFLKNSYPDLISENPIPFDFSKTVSGTITLSNTTTTNATQLKASSSLDFQSVLKSSSAISGEIQIESLLHKVMNIMIENAGAERGILILKKDGKLFVEAEGSISSQDVNVLTNIPLSDYPKISSSLVYYAERTKEPIVLSNAIKDDRFNKEEYVYRNNIISVLCAPILKQGELTGILYLENNLSEAAFSEDRFQVIKVLASQAAISIDNAMLYANMEQKVEDRTRELALANEELGEKNRHITDSINYAKTIQEAILPSKSLMAVSFPDFFITFRPKDIVSGDFYWFTVTDEYFFVAAVDCTGHGVPGAFMSMIGSSLLNQVVKELKITDPAGILHHLNLYVRKALKQDIKEDASRDGMEICLCRFNKSFTEVQFSGGHRPLFIMEDSEFITIKGDRDSIGGKDRGERVFTTHAYQIKKDKKTSIYLSTDGFQDQPNPEGKKIGSKGLQTMIQSFSHLDGFGQKEKFESELDAHSGSEQQRDDVTLIGVILNGK